VKIPLSRIGATAALAAALASAASGQAPLPLATATRGNLELRIRARGTAAWSARLPVQAPMAGRLERLDAQEGRPVAEGALVAVISPAARAALLDAARARGEDPARWQDVYATVPVVAPRAGVAVGVAAQPGQAVAPEAPLFFIADRIVARVFIEEGDAAQVAEGAAATVTLDAFPAAPLRGTVARMAGQAAPYRNAIAVEADIAIAEWPEGTRAGMSLAAEFEGLRREGVVRVPSTAIARINGAPHVYRAQPDGTFLPQPVRTGLTDGVDIEILEGLKEGQTVLADAGLAPEDAGSGGRRRSSPLLPFARPR